MTTLEFLSPVAETEYHYVQPARRLGSIDHATIGLFWNMKPGGDIALRVVEQALGAKYPGITFRHYVGSVGSSVHLATPEDQQLMAAECDAVVGTTGDCGGCTSWLIHDMVGVEELGCPTVSIVAQHFLQDARRNAATLGLESLPMVVIDNTLNNATEADVRSMVEPAIADFERALTVAQEAGAAPKVAPAELEWVAGSDVLGCLEEFNREFVKRGWGDGLPLMPPTPEVVERMLAGTSLARETVIATALYPGLGVATVEKIAINGVMAGCQPEHMPVLIALVRAYEGLGILGKTQAISTGPNAPMVMMSGPVVNQLGFNFSTCVAGPGSVSYVNTVVGRALRLILMNIGQAYPNVLDMDTIGSPNKYSFCLAENAQANPWRPWNELQGFGPEESTLSIACVYPGPDIYDITATTPEELLDTLISMTGSYHGTASAGRWLFGGRKDPVTKRVIGEHHVLLLAPVHAALIARNGWSREDVQNYLHVGSRIPFRKLGTNIVKPQSAALNAAHPELNWLLDQPDTLVGVAEGPECYEVFVTGGDGGRSQFYYGGSEVSTVRVEELPVTAWSSVAEQAAAERSTPMTGTVLCLGVLHQGARGALQAARPDGLELLYYEDVPESAREGVLGSADALLVWSAPLTAEMIRSATQARVIHKVGEGVDKIDLVAAAAAGIPVGRATGVNARSTAELTLLLTLAALRHLPAADRSMRAGQWQKWEVREGTSELYGKQVGIVGFGKIGRMVAPLLGAFGAKVVYHSRRRLPAEDEAIGGRPSASARYVELDELLSTSDVVTLHVPLDAQTRGLIGARELALMKHTAILVNTARGDVVDEAALVEALKDRQIAAAGIDVYGEEPLPADHPLRSIDSAVLTPHMGGVTADSQTRLTEHVLLNIAVVLAGGHLPLEDLVQRGER